MDALTTLQINVIVFINPRLHFALSLDRRSRLSRKACCTIFTRAWEVRNEALKILLYRSGKTSEQEEIAHRASNRATEVALLFINVKQNGSKNPISFVESFCRSNISIESLFGRLYPTMILESEGQVITSMGCRVLLVFPSYDEAFNDPFISYGIIQPKSEVAYASK
ncbi:hypothetical protein IAQ61_003911 [Plenodomus lingam]|uniref:Predicted protein n=1 Tax=Leptosphaeria maculans (strain JN3 / isolate v23.1.3 / race Av1-4-5-6-7-8) TaxID=985895 RepID=E4ZQN3_LEPMJ|nr:predicted protein [Plenodomus lingam JN3]KAH9874721.1 hypothetical protein IAQ61_003911 [Plenodomus lingam]CBX94038.1 predicted protein [Plenodomus lingam JN3]